MADIILASQSPRRKQLLEWAEIEFDVIIAATDESYPQNLTPEEIAIYIAQQKAEAVYTQAPGKTIIAADTIVVWQNEIFGKPKDREDAINTLQKLSGNKHEVITGVFLKKGEHTISFSDVTTVVFHQLTSGQLEYYVEKYQPYDKAGAYAIQEWIGVVGIKSIQGDFYNVMGLPVSRVVQALQSLQ
jgi:septum formation protein